MNRCKTVAMPQPLADPCVASLRMLFTIHPWMLSALCLGTSVQRQCLFSLCMRSNLCNKLIYVWPMATNQQQNCDPVLSIIDQVRRDRFYTLNREGGRREGGREGHPLWSCLTCQKVDSAGDFGSELPSPGGFPVTTQITLHYSIASRCMEYLKD